MKCSMLPWRAKHC